MSWLAIDVGTAPMLRAQELRFAWEQFVAGLGHDEAQEGDPDDVREPIAASWRRCVAAGIDPARVCRGLLTDSSTAEAIAALRVADLERGVDARRCIEPRGELGLARGPDDAALVAGDGSALSAADLPTWLRRARLVSLSLETNGGLCRPLLHVRYGCPDQQEVAA